MKRQLLNNSTIYIPDQCTYFGRGKRQSLTLGPEKWMTEPSSLNMFTSSIPGMLLQPSRFKDACGTKESGKFDRTSAREKQNPVLELLVVRGTGLVDSFFLPASGA